MEVMVIVKASKESEAGMMPSTELLIAMAQYNEELVRGDPAPERWPETKLRRSPGSLFGTGQNGHRWPVCRNQGADFRILENRLCVISPPDPRPRQNIPPGPVRLSGF